MANPVEPFADIAQQGQPGQAIRILECHVGYYKNQQADVARKDLTPCDLLIRKKLC